MVQQRLHDRGKDAEVSFPTGFPSRSRGFTLIEIMIAILILGLVLSTVYAAYSGTMKIVQEVAYENNVYHMARTALDRLIRDLTSISPVNGAFEIRAEKIVLADHKFDSIFFGSAAHLAFSENETEGSAALIGYFVKEDAGSGAFSLRRSDLSYNRAAKEKNMNGGYVICRNIDSLIFKFYDSKGNEYASWDSSSNIAEQKGKAPTAIQIELSLANAANKEKPYKFMTKVFIPAKLWAL